MNVDQTIADVSRLPIDERFRIVHAIWDTLPDDVELRPSAEQQSEPGRRLAVR